MDVGGVRQHLICRLRLARLALWLACAVRTPTSTALQTNATDSRRIITGLLGCTFRADDETFETRLNQDCSDLQAVKCTTSATTTTPRVHL
jgi:hypothetical protein